MHIPQIALYSFI